MSHIRTIVDGKVVEDTPQVESGSYPEMESEISIEQRAIGQMLGFENDVQMGTNKEDIDTVLSWAKQQTEDHSPMNLKWVIRDLKTKLATPPLGESWLPTLVRFAQLSMESKKIQQEQISLVR